MAWIILVPGFLEAVWPTALSRSEGFSKPVPSLVSAVAASMLGLARARRTLPTGTATCAVRDWRTHQSGRGAIVLVEAVWRYPVKSMLGEPLVDAHLAAEGMAGDRRYAVVDVQTGAVASAKQPRLWRSLLSATAAYVNGTVCVRLPGEPVLSLADPDADARLSAFLGRSVRVSDTPAAGAIVDRAGPEEVLAHGVDALVDAAKLVLGQGVPGTTFLDAAPLHVITTATLEHVGAPAARYRPNLVLRTPAGTPPYTESAWVGTTLRIGGVSLRITQPTARCAVPVLAHGSLPPDPMALRLLLAQNRIDVPGLGVVPAAGVYATVERAGNIAVGATAAR